MFIRIFNQMQKCRWFSLLLGIFVIFFYLMLMPKGVWADNVHLLNELVSYWNFDETTGTTLNDLHGNHPGSNTNVTLNQSGKINKAYGFDGSNSVINVGNIALNNRSFSVSMWIANTLPNSKAGFILSQGTESTNYGLSIGRRGVNDKFTFSFYYGSVDSASVVSTGGIWEHWVVTYDSSNKSRKIYKDGVLDASNTASEHYKGTGNLYIGKNITNYYFKGKIDEIGIWNRALTSDEVSALYNSGDGLAYPFSFFESFNVSNTGYTKTTLYADFFEDFENEYSNILNKGFIWDTNQDKLNLDDCINIWTSSNKTDANYTHTITNLTPDTTYYAIAYVEYEDNDENTQIGYSMQVLSFTTLDPLEYLELVLKKEDLTYVRLDYKVEHNKIEPDFNIKEKGLVYSDTNDPKITDNKVKYKNNLNSTYTDVLDINANKIYYFKAYAIDEFDVVHYSNEININTNYNKVVWKFIKEDTNELIVADNVRVIDLDGHNTYSSDENGMFIRTLNELGWNGHRNIEIEVLGALGVATHERRKLNFIYKDMPMNDYDWNVYVVPIETVSEIQYLVKDENNEVWNNKYVQLWYGDNIITSEKTTNDGYFREYTYKDKDYDVKLFDGLGNEIEQGSLLKRTVNISFSDSVSGYAIFRTEPNNLILFEDVNELSVILPYKKASDLKEIVTIFFNNEKQQLNYQINEEFAFNDEVHVIPVNESKSGYFNVTVTKDFISIIPAYVSVYRKVGNKMLLTERQYVNLGMGFSTFFANKDDVINVVPLYEDLECDNPFSGLIIDYWRKVIEDDPTVALNHAVKLNMLSAVNVTAGEAYDLKFGFSLKTRKIGDLMYRSHTNFDEDRGAYVTVADREAYITVFSIHNFVWGYELYKNGVLVQANTVENKIASGIGFEWIAKNDYELRLYEVLEGENKLIKIMKFEKWLHPSEIHTDDFEGVENFEKSEGWRNKDMFILLFLLLIIIASIMEMSWGLGLSGYVAFGVLFSIFNMYVIFVIAPVLFGYLIINLRKTLID